MVRGEPIPTLVPKPEVRDGLIEIGCKEGTDRTGEVITLGSRGDTGRRRTGCIVLMVTEPAFAAVAKSWLRAPKKNEKTS